MEEFTWFVSKCGFNLSKWEMKVYIRSRWGIHDLSTRRLIEKLKLLIEDYPTRWINLVHVLVWMFKLNKLYKRGIDLDSFYALHVALEDKFFFCPLADHVCAMRTLPTFQSFLHGRINSRLLDFKRSVLMLFCLWLVGRFGSFKVKPSLEHLKSMKATTFYFIMLHLFGFIIGPLN